MESWRDTKQHLDRRTGEDYKKLETAILRQLDTVQAVLKSLGLPLGRPGQSVSPPPILQEVCAFLETKGAPQSQYDIIATVGKRRADFKPDLTKPYQDVWKSLKYQQAHAGPIVCVEWKGKKLVEAKLKERPPQRHGREDRAEDYREPENLFWFRDRI